MNRTYSLLAALALAGSMVAAGCTEAPTAGMVDAEAGINGPLLSKKPTGTGGGGGGGKTTNYLSVTLTDGAVTAAPFTAKVSADSDSKIQFNNDDANRVDVQIQLQNTAANEASRCTVTGDPSFRDALVAQLTVLAQSARVGVQVDKLSFGAPSDVNTLTLAYSDPAHPELGGIRLGIPAHGNPPPTVEEVLNDGTNRNYQFHNGVVRVWASPGGGPKNDVKLFCANPSPADGGDAILVSTTKI